MQSQVALLYPQRHCSDGKCLASLPSIIATTWTTSSRIWLPDRAALRDVTLALCRNPITRGRKMPSRSTIPTRSSMLLRINAWLRRRVNSLRFGVHFGRSREAKLPPSLRLSNGHTVVLRRPPEAGVDSDFATIFLDDCYGLLNLALPAQPRILDVGGNIGLFAIASRTRYPRAIIHVYEPNPRLADYVRYHAAQANFEFFPEAIGVERGFVRLLDTADSNLAVSVISQQPDISMTSFSEAIARIGGRVDLLKLDCEGAEWPLLRNSDSWPLVNNVTIEYHLWAASDMSHEKIRTRIQELGFNIRSQIREATTGMIMAGRPVRR